MSAFDLQRAQQRAEARLARTSLRPRRSDAGRSRLSPRVQRLLAALLRGQDKPPMKRVLAELARRSTEPAPSRATVYQFMTRLPTPTRRVAELPASVQHALYNLNADALVPEAQIAFYCFNYGDVGAFSFAASLPWLALYQAVRMRGWRPRSRGPLLAVMRARGI
jgi:hypothetical protein